MLELNTLWSTLRNHQDGTLFCFNKLTSINKNYRQKALNISLIHFFCLDLQLWRTQTSVKCRSKKVEAIYFIAFTPVFYSIHRDHVFSVWKSMVVKDNVAYYLWTIFATYQFVFQRLNYFLQAIKIFTPL